MEPGIARKLSDAHLRRAHPRLDFRTVEGRQFAMRLAPFLAPLVKSGMRVLDLGCGTGKSTFMLSELGAHITGIDASLSTVRFASEIGQSIGATVEHVAGDYAKLPFRSETFDMAVFPHNVVECSPLEFEHVINETARVLIDNGGFVITASYKWSKGMAEGEPERWEGTITIPGQGAYPYPTYSWSVEKIRSAVGARFRMQHSESLPEQNSELLIFRKS